MASCLGEETILGFVEGRLHSDDLQRVELHVRECPICDELLAAAFSRPSAPGAATSRIERGTVIGRYRVLELIGVGGMSEVYTAHDPELDRTIALKVMRPRWAPGATRAASYELRLLQEAQATARLRHPNVISVYDVGTFGERVFLAIEFVDGQTLFAWLREKPRSWREILAVFVDAARGLRAAHAAGVVHRDFKPQNVMVGHDGLVRVMDFGLARFLDADSPAVAPAEAAPAHPPKVDRHVVTGEIAGTPSFMAPEQTRGEAADARTDQFSFCVALHQALYGAHPFGKGGGAPPLPVEGSGPAGGAAPRAVPASLRRVVNRGLAQEPADRWPSMDDLTAALARHLTVARHRAVVAVALATACIVVGAFALVRPWRQEPQRCQGGSQRLADAWSVSRDAHASSPMRATVRDAFLASKVTRAREIWDRVSVMLDQYTTEWLAMYRDTCEADEVRHDEPSDLLNLRVTCLDDSHAALKSLTGLLAAPDGRAIPQAIDAALALPALDRCGASALQHAVRAPKATAEVAARAADIRRRAMTAREVFDAGDSTRGLADEEALLAEARQLDYAPLTAELLLQIGAQRANTYKPNAGAMLREAARLAVRTQRDDLAAEAYLQLGGSNTVSGHVSEGDIWLDLAEALLDRMGEGQPRLRSWLLNDRAIGKVALGQYEEAYRLSEQALALKRKIYPAGHPDIARTLVSQAENKHRMGREPEALALNAQGLHLFETIYGAHHVFVAVALSNRGEYQLASGDARAALATFRAGLAVWQENVGPDHPHLAFPLTGAGRALLALGEPVEAKAMLERAARVRVGDDIDPSLKADTAFALAQALWTTGQQERARRLVTEAEADYRREAAHQHDAEQAQSWLSRHPAARSSPRRHRR